MICWKNGEEVKVNIISIRDTENLILKLNKISSNADQVELIDETGTLYYINDSHIDHIIPDEYNDKNLSAKELIDIIIIGQDDMYRTPPKKQEIKRKQYRPKTDKAKRAQEDAYKKKY